MSKLMGVLKDHVCRLARKEIRLAIGGLKKDRAAGRRALAQLRRQVAAQERVLGALQKTLARKPAEAAATAAAAPAVKGRMTARGVKALRRRLNLSQAEFGRLVGVGGQSVLKWEHRQGGLRLRHVTRQALMALRGLGVREARQRLAEARRPARSKRS